MRTLTFHASSFCRLETFWVPAKHWKKDTGGFGHRTTLLNDKVQKMLISCTWVVLYATIQATIQTLFAQLTEKRITITYGPPSQNVKQKLEDKQHCSYLTEHIQQQSAFHSQENISSSCLEPCVAAMKPKRRIPICFPRGHGGRSQLIPKQQRISATCFLLDHNLYKDSVLRLNILIRTKTLTLPALRSEQLGGDGCTEFVSWPATSILISIASWAMEHRKPSQR